MTDWFTTHDGLLDQMWRCLSAREGAARLPTFATVSPTGWPEARTVVLRAVDAHNAVLECHTDAGSAKIDSLKHAPRAALHVWDAAIALQIRIWADVAVLTGADAAADWALVPPQARRNYHAADAHAIDPAVGHTEGAAQFAVIRCRVQQIDLLHLGEDRHHRARYTRDTGWRGVWLRP